jgi:diguanylate cyclase (GGDEF)-like protein
VIPITHELSLARQLSRSAAILVAIVTSAAIVTALSFGVSSAWMTPEFDRARLAVVTESAAFAAMVNEETALRGYLLTHDVRFLEPYTLGEGELARANLALTAYVGSIPEIAATMLAARLAEESWRDHWAQASAHPGPDAVAPTVLEGKTLFDAYRRAESAFAAALGERGEALSRREQRTTMSRVALELIVFMAVLLLVVRQHRALRDATVAPVAALLLHIGRIRDGELVATIESKGPQELRELAQGLNEIVSALTLARASAESRDEALRGHSVRLRQILDASREFSESLNLKYVVAAVRESTAAVGGSDVVVVWLMDDEQKRLVDVDADAAHVSASDAPIGPGQGLAGRAAKSGRIAFEGLAGQVRFTEGHVGLVRAIAIPLIVGARVVGALETRYTEGRGLTIQAIEILEMLATHAATAIESARLHELTEVRSQMDALTRLCNRRRLDEDLDAECKRCLRYGRPLALVMLDVDHFKLFNDTHGHSRADTALQEVADVVAGCVRTTDTAYRYGGEEFCVLLRETTGQDAMVFAERVRNRIEQRFASRGGAAITASFGVAEFSAVTPLPRALVDAADAAMYESKHAGRNRIALRSSPSVAVGISPAEVTPLLS